MNEDPDPDPDPDPGPASRRAQPLARYLTHIGWRSMAPLVVAALLLAAYALLRVHQHQSVHLERGARHLAMEVEADLARRLHGLQALRLSTDEAHPHVLPGEDLKVWYQHAVTYDRTFDTPVLMADATRRVLFLSRSPFGTALPPLPPPKGRPAFAEALSDGQPSVGDVTQGPMLRRALVPLIVPVPPDAWSESPERALLGLVPIRVMQALLQTQDIPPAWRVRLTDGAGQTIAALGFQADNPLEPGAALPASPSAALSTVAAPARPDPTTIGATPVDPQFTVWLRTAPWALTVEVPFAAFYAPHLRVGVALLMVLALALLGADWFARRASTRLVEAVQQIAAGPATRSEAFEALAVSEFESVRRDLDRLREGERLAERAERKRIARDLHDGLQQEIAAVAIELDLAMRHPGVDAAEQPAVRRARDGLDRISQEIRCVVHKLRPLGLEGASHEAALQAWVDQFAEVTGLQVELEFIGPAGAFDGLPVSLADSLYRCAQEGLNNVRKHARATFVHLVVDLSDPKEGHLRVSDDGIGIGAAPAPGSKARGTGGGLQGLRDRAESLHGGLRIERGHDDDPTTGTTLSVWFPRIA